MAECTWEACGSPQARGGLIRVLEQAGDWGGEVGMVDSNVLWAEPWGVRGSQLKGYNLELLLQILQSSWPRG